MKIILSHIKPSTYYNYLLMQHFRDRFNTFGTVSSVEVIQRADENGM